MEVFLPCEEADHYQILIIPLLAYRPSNHNNQTCDDQDVGDLVKNEVLSEGESRQSYPAKNASHHVSRNLGVAADEPGSLEIKERWDRDKVNRSADSWVEPRTLVSDILCFLLC